MEQFLAVAVAHFLALLIPGVDFFLIARTAMTSGWRNASGACVGIASANGIFIAAAFSGLSLVSDPAILHATQAAGGAFLTYVGIVFLRARPSTELSAEPPAARVTWMRSLGFGLASGLLNPKNALFYVSLAAALTDATPAALTLYGTWMVALVLGWDLFVAVVLGSERALAGLSRVLPWLTRAAGGFLLLFGLGMIVALAARPA
ncbi:LysE family translocator [Myceligenerans indicum]|uniref:LysE family transporter n=1 Tax=Myceligenerans indicum TaxID=2593663 RepID=A0ABS1LRB3_9MICO|nr:LysE family transporter [Myceligenerans indicum]MBL0888698.1 LysE family transporter [Myceligenerans indicum]